MNANKYGKTVDVAINTMIVRPTRRRCITPPPSSLRSGLPHGRRWRYHGVGARGSGKPAKEQKQNTEISENIFFVFFLRDENHANALNK